MRDNSKAEMEDARGAGEKTQKASRAHASS